MNRLRYLMLATVAALGVLVCSQTADAQVRLVPNRGPAVGTQPYYYGGAYPVYYQDYSRYINYGPYYGQGVSAIQPGSPGYNGMPVTAAPVYVEPDPYYAPVYVVPRPTANRSNWGLDNINRGSLYRR